MPGPLLLVCIVGQWILLLSIGFALIYWPELGSGLSKSQGPTPTGFLAALYYSGFCLSTLGIGDIAPTTGAMRLLTVVEAALGFSVFTLTITYVLSIYNALQQRNTLASTLHHKCAGTGDPRAWLQSLALGAPLAGARDGFAQVAAQLSQLVEAHTFYPLLHYFHFHQSRYALPRLTHIVMDMASLLQSLPMPGRETAAAALGEMQNACRDLLERAKKDFLHQYQPADYPATAADLEDWRRHYRQTARRLRDAGVALPGELGDGEAAYLALRRDWHPYIVAFSRSLGYELDEVMPHP